MRNNGLYRSAISAGALLALGANVAQADEIDTYIQQQMALQHIPGLSLVVVKEGKVIKAKGYGYANLEWKIPATPDTVYQIGSITKQFTATLVMILVEDKKVDLDATITTFLTGLPDAWKDITVRQLLTHTSGIPNYTEVPDFIRTTTLPTTHEGMIKFVADRPLNFPPGEQWRYSNTNYYLLGMIIEKASGKSFASFLQERILTPLGMTSTSVNDLATLVPHRASGYEGNGATWRNSPVISMTWPFAAGAMLSTVKDFVRWDEALFTDRLLKRSRLEEMWSPVKLKNGSTSGYGFGWAVETVKGHRMVSHGGGIPGFVTQTTRFPEDRVMVTVFTNTGCDPGRIANAIARWQIPDLMPVQKVVSLKREKLMALTGYYSDGPFLHEAELRDGRLWIGASGFGPSWFEWQPESETRFFARDSLNGIEFSRNGEGRTLGYHPVDTDGKPRPDRPYIGPRFADIRVQTDPDTAFTAKCRAILQAIGQGGKAEEEIAGITDGARRDFAGSGLPDFADIRSLTYVAEVDIEGRGIERHGGKVARVLYYRIGAGGNTRNLLLYVTAGGLVTDFDFV